MPKFLGNNYENKRFNIRFAANLITLRSIVYV